MATLLEQAQAKTDAKRKASKPPPHDEDRPSRIFDAADLMAMDMADPAYLNRPFVAEGVTLVCGRPKMGKTTLLRGLARAVNTAGEFFGTTCARADTLFLSLEEGPRLMRRKFQAMGAGDNDLRGIQIVFEWPQGSGG